MIHSQLGSTSSPRHFPRKVIYLFLCFTYFLCKSYLLPFFKNLSTFLFHSHITCVHLGHLLSHVQCSVILFKEMKNSCQGKKEIIIEIRVNTESSVVTSTANPSPLPFNSMTPGSQGQKDAPNCHLSLTHSKT